MHKAPLFLAFKFEIKMQKFLLLSLLMSVFFSQSTVASGTESIDSAITACKAASQGQDNFVAGYCIGIIHGASMLIPVTKKGGSVCSNGLSQEDMAMKITSYLMDIKVIIEKINADKMPSAGIPFERMSSPDLILYSIGKNFICLPQS
ncbi:hypothetical protein [Aeromonas sanarellii]|uniref:hypothetical protein n=1 Tax=Aeromonas sanarellii TaxID=633415 RepID=UPI0038D17EE2